MNYIHIFNFILMFFLTWLCYYLIIEIIRLRKFTLTALELLESNGVISSDCLTENINNYNLK